MFYNKKLQGEIATTLTIVAVILMGAGALIGGQLSNKYMTVNSRAESPCVIVQAIDNPHLNQTNKTCEVKITFTPGNPQPASPTSLTCALINPTIQNGSQLVARTNLPKNPPVDVFNQTNIGTFPLVRDNGASQTMTLSGSQKYRLVVYDWNNPNCKSENNEMPADTINGLFGSGGTAVPTNTPLPNQPTNTPTHTPTPIVQCKTEPLNGFCVLEQTCNTMGAQIKVMDNFGCSSISSDYVCCVREAVYSTPVPTWTPVPTSTPTPMPTPTTRPQPTATINPQADLACYSVVSVAVDKTQVYLGEAFTCQITYSGSNEKDYICAIRKVGISTWDLQNCSYTGESGKNISFSCTNNSSQEGLYELIGFKMLPSCHNDANRNNNSNQIVGVKVSSPITFTKQQSASQTNLSLANVKMEGNCPAQPKMAQNYAQITVSGKTALIQTNLKTDNQFNRLDANCL